MFKIFHQVPQASIYICMALHLSYILINATIYITAMQDWVKDFQECILVYIEYMLNRGVQTNRSNRTQRVHFNRKYSPQQYCVYIRLDVVFSVVVRSSSLPSSAIHKRHTIEGFPSRPYIKLGHTLIYIYTGGPANMKQPYITKKRFFSYYC